MQHLKFQIDIFFVKSWMLLAVSSVLIAGCSQQPSDQMAELQRQNAELMLSVSNLQSRVDELYQVAYVEGHKIDSNSAAIDVLIQDQLRTETDKLNSESATATSADFASGIPADVEAKIEADAAQEFPDNYVMQQAAIQSQEAAYKSLHQ